jgi:biopolymer transport protein ExbD
MRRKSFPRAVADDPQTDVSSLVDVSFLMLIFFLVTSTIVKRETDLPMALPSDGTPAAIPILPLWIEVAADGTVTLGRDEAAMALADPAADPSLETLASHLRMAREAALPDAIPVVMSVADGVRQQRFIDVLNCLAGVGIENVTMVDATEED